MVRRLVEQEQIRLLHEQPGQMRAHDPAAAHLPRRPVEILFAKAQPGKDLLGLGFKLIAAEFVETVVDIVVNFFRVQRLDGMVRFPGFDDPAEFRVFGRDRGGKFHDGFIPHGRAFLGQMAEGNAAFENDLAVVGGFFAENEGKERGLPGAVRSDQPDAVLAVHLKRGVGEQDASAVRFADAGKREH